MRKHPVRKFIGLTLLYAALIVGIFVIQFKAESVISETIAGMRVTLAETETSTGAQELKNTLQLAYKGLTFYANEDTPAYLTAPNGVTTDLTLSSWRNENQPSWGSVRFEFTDGSAIEFSTKEEFLFITALPSDPSKSITLPYKISGTNSIYEQTESRLVLSEKNAYRALSAPSIESGRIVFAAGTSYAQFAEYDPTKRFEFSILEGTEGSELSSFDSIIQQLKVALVNSFTQILNSTQADSLTENEVVAYVAEMALNGRYDTALDAVPESFKRGNRRTYVSAPYFDNLVNMNRSLTVQTEKYNSQVDQAVATQNPDIFTVDNITDFILREKKTARMEAMLSIPSSKENFEPSVSQATGIINVYCKLLDEGEERLASLLEEELPVCISAIESACSYDSDSNVLTVTENEQRLSVTQAFLTGKALISLGKIQDRSDLTATGCLIISQEGASLSSFRLSQLAELYPIVVENEFYPHSTVLGYYNDSPVWTWTCAQDITYTKTSDGTIDIRIQFPLGNTHYIIINGVPTFHANIEIQGMPFRTDPRFETYNSSGYVYQSDTQTLFLKSRHKSQSELIRLGCDPTTTFSYVDGTRP